MKAGKTKEQLINELAALRRRITELETSTTERKQAEETLRDSEQFFSGTLNDMLTFVAVLEPDGKVIFANDTPLNAAGIKLEDVIGKMFYDTYWWAYSKEAKNKVKSDIETCASGKTLHSQIKVQMADGELIWVDFSMHPICDEEGKVKYVVPEGRDITDRKKAEKALRDSKEQYRSLIESSEDHIYLIDGNLNYLYANEKLLSRYGKPLEEVIGQNYSKFHSLEVTKEFSTKFGYIFESGNPLTYVHKSRRDGKYFIRTLSPVIDKTTGKTTAVTVISKDITERKQIEETRRKTEEHFRKVIENIFKFVPEGLLVFTDKINLFKQNKAFQNIVKEYANKLNYTERELAEIIIEQVKNRIINEDYADIRIPENKDRETKNKQNNF